jgi:hypothetical protein
MTHRRVCRLFLVAGLTCALLGAGAAGTLATQAGAAKVVHMKKGPPKKKKKHHGKKLSGAKKLKELASDVAVEKGATFEVSYSVNSDGHTQSITFAQAPPKYLLKTESGSVIYTGSETLYCVSSSSCVSTTTTGPFASLMDLFSATRASAFFDQAEVEIGTKEAGYSVSFSTGTYGGLASQCATVTGHGHSGKFCVSKNGLFTYGASSTGGSITLTSYTSTVPGTAFTPPSGATISTIPSGA